MNEESNVPPRIIPPPIPGAGAERRAPAADIRAMGSPVSPTPTTVRQATPPPPPLEKTARQKFSCAACGGEARWDPAKKALVCPYCGTVAPAQLELNAAGDEVIREHDLTTALRSLPSEKRGWQANKTQVRCQHCNAISVFDPQRVAQRCDFCGSSALVPYEQVADPISPESLLPLHISENQVRETIRGWYRGRWLAPNKLKRHAVTDTVKGLYIPYWTFDAQVHADWTADSGYYYWDTETYRDSNGRLQTRQVRKVRWVPSSGSLDHFFDDELIPASRGIDHELLRRVEPFPTKELKPYNPGFLSGWVVERYQIDLLAAAQHSRAQMDSKLNQLCASQVPGDTHRNLRVFPDYSGQTFKHVLVPVWLLSYLFRQRSYQVVINGVTGQIAGRYPKSWVKITLLVLLVLIISIAAGLIAMKQ